MCDDLMDYSSDFADADDLDTTDFGDDSIETLDFDDGAESGLDDIDFGDDDSVETLDFDDGAESGLDDIDFGDDDSVDTLDFDDGTESDLDDIDFGDDDSVETLDFDDGTESDLDDIDFGDDDSVETLDFDDGAESGLNDIDFGDDDSVETLDFGDDGGETADVEMFADENIDALDTEDAVDSDGQDISSAYNDDTESPLLESDLWPEDGNAPDIADSQSPYDVSHDPLTNEVSTPGDVPLGPEEGGIPLDSKPPMTDEELAQFTDWENAYGEEINNIKTDDTLSDAQKADLLQSSFNEFQQNSKLPNYVDADMNVDSDPAKVLTKQPNHDLASTNSNGDYYNDVPPAVSDVQPISDIDNWIGDINPNYDAFDPESPFSNNCGSCAYAVYQRLEGNNNICASAENIGYNDEMEALTGMEQVSMSPDEIESRLLEQGNGAHAIIGIDRAEGAGHWFNAACIDGKVVAIDGQTGEINDWPPDYGNVVNWEMSVKKGK